MLFSVVIPTRNRFQLLQDALIGLDYQTLPATQFEVIVVDNGSMDGTYERLRAEAATYNFKLIVIKNPDCEHGPAPARNLGVRAASGDVIAFLDSDCRPDENWLAEAATVFSADLDLAFATGIIDFKPEQLSRMNFFSRKTVVALEEHPTYPTANSFYRRAIFLQHDGFNESLSFPNIFGQSVEAADTDLAWRVRDAGGKYRFIRQAVVFHEVQDLSPGEWLLEPLRLFLLPALIQLHPGLRPKLLKYNLFFYGPSTIYYGFVLLLLAAAVIQPSWLLALPVAVLVLAVIKAGTVSPEALLRSLAKLFFNTARNYIMIGALIYGSIRYRTLVL